MIEVWGRGALKMVSKKIELKTIKNKKTATTFVIAAFKSGVLEF